MENEITKTKNGLIKDFLIILSVMVIVLSWSCERNSSERLEIEQTEKGDNEENGQIHEQEKREETKTVGAGGGNPMVVISTTRGDIKIELYPDKAPITVENFMGYVNDGFYDGTIFHRVIPGFMIQGGGFTSDMNQKPTKEPIKNEANNGLKNEKGTIAMARTNQVDSATSQFFINHADNEFLNHGSRDYGYAVFGKVVEGMDIVEKISAVKTGTVGHHRDVPEDPVIIESARVIQPDES